MPRPRQWIPRDPPLTLRQRLVIEAAARGPLKRIRRRWFDGDGAEFNEDIVCRLRDRGLVDFDPFSETVVATERGRARAAL